MGFEKKYIVPNASITGATKTKVTYDSKGLITSGTDATKSDVGLGNVDNTSDANKPVSTAQKLIIDGYDATATSAGTLVLTVDSNIQQFFTGITTHIVTMPVVTTLQLGRTWKFRNASTGAVTINSSGGNAIFILPPGGTVQITCIAVTGTDASSWSIINPPTLLLTGTEVATNEYIDGNRVYCKIVNYGTMPNNTSKNVAHGISSLNVAKILRTNAMFSNGTDSYDVARLATTYLITATNISISTGTDRTAFSCPAFYIYYYK